MSTDTEVQRVGEVTIALGKGRPQQGEKPAVGPVYRNIAAKDEWPTIEGCTTLYEVFERSVTKYFSCKCLGWRPVSSTAEGDVKEQHSEDVVGDYTFITYEETHERVAAVASAMKAVGIEPRAKVGMYAGNCVEWMLVLQACNRNTYYPVPLYDSLGEHAIEYIVNHAEVSIAFVQAQKVPLFAKALAIESVKKHVKTVVVFGGVDDKLVKQISDLGISVHQFDEFLAMGRTCITPPTPPKPEDPACIMYTSGTTGNPKGVLITHRNLATGVASAQQYAEQAGIPLRSDDSMLSYLTLAHIFDRILEELAISVGASIGYWQGDIKKLTDDVAALRPTLFIAVPRVLDRMATGIQAKVSKRGVLVRYLLNWAVSTKLSYIKAGYQPHEATPLLDSWVFSPFKQAFGGRLRFVVSGGAPLAEHIEEYLKVVLGVPVLQGYGLTETCAATFLNLPKKGMEGTVGPPLPGIEIRLQGIPEMNYDPFGTPPRGEVCFRGPMVFGGYFHDDAKTKEAFDEDGFFHSGDVGEITEAGCLKVIDRIKNMFKLAHGEYIAAEFLENVFSGAPVVSQVWVFGNSLESVLVAVVHPEAKELKAWADKEGLGGKDLKALCQEPKAKQFVLAEMTRIGKENKLKGFEFIKAVHLEPEEFSVENGLITPSLKMKRPQLKKHYEKAIDEMYASTKK